MKLKIALSTDFKKAKKNISAFFKAIIAYFNIIYKTEIKGFYGLLAQNYRKINAKIIFKITGGLFLVIFLLSFIFKPSLQKAQEKYLAHPTKANQLALTAALIEANNFPAARRELKKFTAQELNAKQRAKLEQLQKDLVFNSPQDIKNAIVWWESFLNDYPHYKYGWLYLAFFQARIGQNEKAQKSLQQAKLIDPALENNQLEKYLGE